MSKELESDSFGAILYCTSCSDWSLLSSAFTDLILLKVLSRSWGVASLVQEPWTSEMCPYLMRVLLRNIKVTSGDLVVLT